MLGIGKSMEFGTIQFTSMKLRFSEFNFHFILTSNSYDKTTHFLRSKTSKFPSCGGAGVVICIFSGSRKPNFDLAALPDINYYFRTMRTDILDYLINLTEAQDEVLVLLHEQQAVLVKPEKEALESITAEEEAILEKMRKMLDSREEILTAARLQNIPGDSIEQLCGHFFPHNVSVRKLLDGAKHRTQQISILAYTNWMVGRKSMILISQIRELLETGGQGKTTYQPQPDAPQSRGGLVDRVA